MTKPSRLLLPILIALASLPRPASAGVEDNKALVRRMVEAMNARDFATLAAVIAPDIQRHCAATPGVVVDSREDFFAFLRQDFAAVPDSVQEIDRMLAEGDLVAARVFYRGTQKNAWGPYPASGERVELPFISILRIADGQVAEIWVEWDNLNLLQQLGHAPPAAEEAKPDRP